MKFTFLRIENYKKVCQGKIREFWTDWKSPGNLNKILETSGNFGQFKNFFFCECWKNTGKWIKNPGKVGEICQSRKVGTMSVLISTYKCFKYLIFMIEWRSMGACVSVFFGEVCYGWWCEESGHQQPMLPLCWISVLWEWWTVSSGCRWESLLRVS